MFSLNFPNHVPLNILCLGAHCDDIEIGAGCTLLKLIEEHEIEEVNWVVFASNEERKQEATNSAHKFLKDVPDKKIAIKSWRDGYLPFQAMEIKEFFENLKTEITPNIIFTHYRNDRHQDHRLISDLTWNTWRNHLILEYEIPKYDGDLGIPNFFVSLNKEMINTRDKILFDSFVSQTTKQWFTADALLSLKRLRGIESATEFAEAFYARKIVV
jgi:LmbE family N-acetylglucosaminyl deacetylase